MKPTDEQEAAVAKFATGRPLKIAAFAGAGKTSTLKLLAQSRRTPGLYLAFNKSIANEAKEKFPRSVECKTTHALAFRAIMPNYQSAPKMTKSMLAKQLAVVMGYEDHTFPGPLRLNGVHQAHLVLGTVRRFCQSRDTDIALTHVPTYGRLLGASEGVISNVRQWSVEEARRLWARMIKPGDEIPLGHDGYLKLWALARPKLKSNYILLDEAQDTNDVVLGVLADQDAQIVYVGDRHQQIYEWRGAINAMESIKDCEEASLTQSFRFGATIAGTATRVLATLGETHAVRGNPAVNSSILDSGRTKAVLARTNAVVILEILEAITAGQKPFVVGGTQEIKRLLSDVFELKKNNPGVSPEFFGFENWPEVVEFAATEEGESLKTFVQLVEQHGERKLWAAVKQAHEEEASADVVLSTAHKAKGREWDSVRLASDFAAAPPLPESEVRLFYVAMTRAKKTLVATSDLLEVFTTDAWKKKPAKEARRATPTRPVEFQLKHTKLPPQRPTPIREVTPVTAVNQHPGAVRPAAPSAARAPGPIGGRPLATPRTPQPQPPTKPVGLWGRIAKFFS